MKQMKLLVTITLTCGADVDLENVQIHFTIK